jgi:DNA polymerase III alpha subunit
MASLTKRIQPEHLYHLAAANAVVRPGVSQHAESYVARRHGEHFEYWDDAVEPALRETYGLPIYQEQIMAVFNMLGGYSPAEADDVRRIMGKYYRMKGGVARQMLDVTTSSASSRAPRRSATADRRWPSRSGTTAAVPASTCSTRATPTSTR